MIAGLVSLPYILGAKQQDDFGISIENFTFNLDEVSTVKAIDANIPYVNLYVRTDSSATDLEIDYRHGSGLSVDYCDSTSTLVLSVGADYEEAGGDLTITLPAGEELSLLRVADTARELHVRGIDTPSLAISDIPSSTVISDCRIGALTLCSFSSGDFLCQLTVSQSSIAAIMSNMKRDDIDMSISRSSVADIVFASDR